MNSSSDENTQSTFVAPPPEGRSNWYALGCFVFALVLLVTLIVAVGLFFSLLQPHQMYCEPPPCGSR